MKKNNASEEQVTNEVQRTPTPWKWTLGMGTPMLVSAANGQEVLVNSRTHPNAKFIVHAVNAYDANQETIAALLAVTKRFSKAMGQGRYPELQGIWTEADQALAQAKEK